VRGEGFRTFTSDFSTTSEVVVGIDACDGMEVSEVSPHPVRIKSRIVKNPNFFINKFAL